MPTKPFVFSKLSAETTQALPFEAFVNRAYPQYKWYDHAKALAKVLQRVADDELHRVMIYEPPRHGKSEEVSRLFTAYYLYRHPERWVGLNSYGAELAYALSRSSRDYFQAVGGKIRGDAAAVKHWQTSRGGGLWAAGVGGPITGKGFHLGVIDDPLKNAEEADSQTIRDKHKDWYRSTFYTRGEPGNAVVAIGTRWHEDDLFGWLLSQETQEDADTPEHWHIVNFPAIRADDARFPEPCTIEPDMRAIGQPLCQERYPLERLEKIRLRIGSRFWEALYQQNPQPPKGAVFQRTWFARRNAIARHNAVQVIQAWDTAFKEGQENDRSACVTLAAHSTGIFVLDAWRDTVAYPDLIRRMQQKAAQWQPDVILVEDKGSGTSAVQTLRAQTQLPIVAQPTQGRTKTERANQVTGFCEAGRVVLPETPWADDLLDELIRFPTGAHDDQVDAFVYALHRITGGMFAVSSMEY